MNRYRFLLLAMLAGPWALIAAPADDKANPSASASRLPAVLRSSEVSDSGIVMLPGPAPATSARPVEPSARPSAAPSAPLSDPPIAQPVRPALPANLVETILRPA